MKYKLYDVVYINDNSKYKKQGYFKDIKKSGVIVVAKKDKDGLHYKVKWEGGDYNFYGDDDLILAHSLINKIIQIY